MSCGVKAGVSFFRCEKVAGIADVFGEVAEASGTGALDLWTCPGFVRVRCSCESVVRDFGVMSCGFEDDLAFLFLQKSADLADCLPELTAGSGCGLSDQSLESGEFQGRNATGPRECPIDLDGIEVGAAGRREQEPGADVVQGRGGLCALVAKGDMIDRTRPAMGPSGGPGRVGLERGLIDETCACEHVAHGGLAAAGPDIAHPRDIRPLQLYGVQVYSCVSDQGRAGAARP